MAGIGAGTEGLEEPGPPGEKGKVAAVWWRFCTGWTRPGGHPRWFCEGARREKKFAKLESEALTPFPASVE